MATFNITTFFNDFPEIKASAICKNIGMSKSLMSQYVSGAKVPSKKQINRIFSEIQRIAKEFQNV